MDWIYKCSCVISVDKSYHFQAIHLCRGLTLSSLLTRRAELTNGLNGYRLGSMVPMFVGVKWWVRSDVFFIAVTPKSHRIIVFFTDLQNLMVHAQLRTFCRKADYSLRSHSGRLLVGVGLPVQMQQIHCLLSQRNYIGSINNYPWTLGSGGHLESKLQELYKLTGLKCSADTVL